MRYSGAYWTKQEFDIRRGVFVLISCVMRCPMRRSRRDYVRSVLLSDRG
ncbi:hypothetical protein C7S17_5836 [Burkholderia thailandensis]|nr:hypothetical protein [Burkholderia thailandensis]